MVKPNFTGTWKFSTSKSSLQVPAPDSSTFVIKHQEPQYHFTRTHIIGEDSDTFSIDLTTDGREYVQSIGDVGMHARLYWDGDMLVFDSILSQGDMQVINVVRYHLEDNGQTLIADEHAEGGQHAHDNHWVFDKEA